MAGASADSRGAAPIDSVRLATNRGELFFWTAFIVLANSLASLAIFDISNRGFAASAIDLFGISAIVAVASTAGLALAKQDSSPPVRADWLVISACVISALLPNHTVSRFMLSVLGAYLAFSSASASTMRRAGVIMIALSGALFWGQAILVLLGRPVLELDAMLVSWLYGFERVGNTMAFVDGTPGGIIIAAGCSSWHGMSIALLFWVTVQIWFAIPFRKTDLLWLILALLATILINSLRLAALTTLPLHYDMLHHGYGASIASWTTMLLVIAVCLFGGRREIFAR